MTRRLTAFLSAALLAAPAYADDAIGVPAVLELLPGWRADGGHHMAALRIVLADGWKTYWRAPGEAGIPPMFDWAGSDNLAEVRFHWPVPEVMHTNGMTTLVYSDEVVIPMEVIPVDAAAPVGLVAEVHMGVCQEICVPFDAAFTGALAAGGEADARITHAIARQPDSAAEAGLTAARCAVAPIADGVTVTASLTLPALGADEHVVIEPADPSTWASEAIVLREGGVLTASVDLVPAEAKPFDLDTQSLRLTVLAEGRAVDIQGCDPAP